MLGLLAIAVRGQVLDEVPAHESGWCHVDGHMIQLSFNQASLQKISPSYLHQEGLVS